MSYSPYDLLGIKAGDNFAGAVVGFEQHARRLELVAAALEEREDVVDQWRALCEALDWMVKQPVREIPTKEMTCPGCGLLTKVRVLGETKCQNCGLLISAEGMQKVLCTSCQQRSFISTGSNPSDFSCLFCKQYTLVIV